MGGWSVNHTEPRIKHLNFTCIIRILELQEIRYGHPIYPKSTQNQNLAFIKSFRYHLLIRTHQTKYRYKYSVLMSKNNFLNDLSVVWQVSVGFGLPVNCETKQKRNETKSTVRNEIYRNETNLPKRDKIKQNQNKTKRNLLKRNYQNIFEIIKVVSDTSKL